MKPKLSFKPKLSINAFGVNRFFIGISIALFSIIISYFFLFCLRETFRLFTSHLTGTIQVKELNLSAMIIGDFLLAMLACQIGQMVFFEFCFSKPTKLAFWNFRKQSILVDNRNLLAYFLFIGLKIGLVIALFLYLEMYDLFQVNGIIFWIFVLAIITIHLNSWQTIIRTFRNSNQWILYTFGGMIVCSFLLTQVHPIDYQKVNKRALNKIPDYNLQIELPKANYNILNKNLGYWNFRFALQQNDQKIILMNSKDTIQLEDILTVFERRFRMLPRSFENKIFVSLSIDKDVKMGTVFNLKQTIREAGFKRIAYILIPSNNPFSCFYPFNYQNSISEAISPICHELALKESLSLLKRTKSMEIFNYNIGCHPYSMYWREEAIALQSKINIELTENGNILIDSILEEHPIPIFENLFSKKENQLLFFIIINKNAKYEDYIHLQEAMWKARQNILNVESLRKHGIPYSTDLPPVYQKSLALKYPIVIVEPNSKIELEIYQELERIGKITHVRH